MSMRSNATIAATQITAAARLIFTTKTRVAEQNAMMSASPAHAIIILVISSNLDNELVAQLKSVYARPRPNG